MKITKKTNANTITLALEGRLDTVTSTQLASELGSVFEAGLTDLVFDFSALDYISSAGLRVLLNTQKKINALSSTMKITGANDMVKEVFELTGFSGIMDIA